MLSLILNKKVLNFVIIITLSTITFGWSFFIFHLPISADLVIIVIILRILSSALILKDYSLSWSKVTQNTFLLKGVVYIIPFFIYMPYFYGEYRFSFLVSELFLYLFAINFIMYSYYYFINKSNIKKTISVVIYGAGSAGVKLKNDFTNSKYNVRYLIDDAKKNQNRSIDGVSVISKESFIKRLDKYSFDMLVIAMPSQRQMLINTIYDELHSSFKTIKILPTLSNILQDKGFSAQLKDISVEDLLARRPKDLDKVKIAEFIQGKTILITGAGGSIGSEIARQCVVFNAKKIILLDHSEFNLYQIQQEIGIKNVVAIMQSVVNLDDMNQTFITHNPDIVIHAAAYKHVPLVEENVHEAIVNNVIGTKNVIDVAIKNNVQKVILISTDKAVRPTNVMGATKRICELYAQNIQSRETEIVSVRFGNVLASSGSVIPKFNQQIQNGENLTVTHPDITRYFMLISEACELVLQAASLATGGEIFILDMGKPIKIVDLANKMIELSGRDDIEIEFSGLRTGEKLYEELLIDETDFTTKYDSITIATPKQYPIDDLNNDIVNLINNDNKIQFLAKIVPEFKHQLNQGISVK